MLVTSSSLSLSDWLLMLLPLLPFVDKYETKNKKKLSASHKTRDRVHGETQHPGEVPASDENSL